MTPLYDWHLLEIQQHLSVLKIEKDRDKVKNETKSEKLNLFIQWLYAICLCVLDILIIKGTEVF